MIQNIFNELLAWFEKWSLEDNWLTTWLNELIIKIGTVLKDENAFEDICE